MQHTVNITKDLVDKYEYDNIVNCPLYHAIKEQLPEFSLIWVRMESVIQYIRATNTYKVWKFNEDHWNEEVYNHMKLSSSPSPVVLLFVDY